ncbi:MAG: hypothetical protein A2857_01230 [Candidatus Levybacteria bacterium RIFCSPHIGHO2_01_FULL_36_15]|nr:MAG: hypothetical protein A2857_01230 [Candidatus Levybacteria bacterium RIFCSPHIGHO2_01_FULL_36_15]
MKSRADIILPIHHEEDNVEKVVIQIDKNVKTPHRLFFVYDEDNDPSIYIVKKLKKKFPNIYLLKNDYGKGIVNALKTGFNHAKSEIIVTMMADLSDDPKVIDKMVKKIDQGLDMVCASRYSKSGARKGGPFMKALISYLGCLTLNILTGIPTRDSTNAFKCFRKNILKKIEIQSVGGFELPLELAVKSYFLGYRIGEIPTVWEERKSGKSKFKFIQWLPHYLRWYLYAVRSRYGS